GHNLFSVGQFCDSDLEVAFRQHTCFIRNLEGVDLLTGSRGNNLYTLLLQDMMASSPICLLSKASKTKSWLWHRRLSHLNFGAINHLARQGLVRGLLKLKFEKDHLCSACAMGKSTKKSHNPKSEDTNQEKLYLLHMDLYGPMRVESINEKKYILVNVDDYSRFTWVKFLRSKDETPMFIIKFLKMIQRLSHLNFDTINDLARNDLVACLPKFKYHKEHICPSCEQGKSKRASHPPKPVPNLRQRLHLLHMDLCGPMRIASIIGKRYVLVIVDDYSRYTWSPVIIIRTDNGIEFKNQVLKEYFDTVGISHQMSSVRTPQQNGVVERRNRTLVEAARTMLIFSRAPLFLWAEAIATAVYNRKTKKIIETMNVSFDELSAMAFEQCSSKPGLNSMTSGQISLGLDLTYAPSTITLQQPSEGELDLLFEAIYDDYIGARTVPSAQEHQVRQSSTASTTIADTAPIPTNSSSPATNIPITSQDVDELNPNAMIDGNMFVNSFANSSTSAGASSSHQNLDPSNMHTFYQPYPHEFQ
nr:putative ribonuclease H-like domain-containing protein [Tanacetum cinerariifolium]